MYYSNLGVEEVVDKYSNLIYRIAILQLNSKQDAEDVVQEVLIRYMRSSRIFNDEEHEKYWLIKVTENYCKDLKMSAWMRKKTELKDDIVFEDKSESDVYEVIKQLKDKYKIVIQLFYYEEMTIKQISEALNLNENTVKVRLNRARKELKKLLKGDECNE